LDVIEKSLKRGGKVETKAIKMNDCNSVVGDKSYLNIAGPHGAGRRNQRSQILIDFGKRNNVFINNTRFKKPKRRLYTWKAPGDRSRHQ